MKNIFFEQLQNMAHNMAHASPFLKIYSKKNILLFINIIIILLYKHNLFI